MAFAGRCAFGDFAVFGFGKKQGPTIGLDINSSTISLIELNKSKTGTSVGRFQSMPTPPDMVREGLLTDPEAIGNALKELLEAAGITSKKGQPVANIGIPGQAVVIRLMPVPTGMPPEELADVVRQEAINNLPFPLEEANTDFCLLPATERTDPDGVKRVDVLLAAIQRIVVDSYWRMATAANIKLGHLDISSLAVIRALANAGLLKDDGQLSMAVNIRNDATDITLTKKGMPLFSRSVLLGVETLGEAISRSIDVPMDEAISLLPKMSLGSVPTSDPKLGQAAQVARSVFGDLIAEVGRSLEFYMSQVGIIQVDQVLITGPGCVVPGIDEFVANRLNITATIANPFTNLTFDEAAITEHQRPALAMLVGLVTDQASADMKTVAIDLNKGEPVPMEAGAEGGEEGEEGEAEVDTPWFVPALIAGGVCMALPLIAYAIFNYMFNRASDELSTLESEVSRQNKQVDALTKSQDELGGLRQKEAILERIVKHGTPISGLLQLIRETIPEGVEVYHFTATPYSYRANCAALDFARASHFAINMEGTHLFSNVELGSLHRLSSHPQAVAFDISAAVSPEIAAKHVDETDIASAPKPVPDTAEEDEQAGNPATAPGAHPIAGRGQTK